MTWSHKSHKYWHQIITFDSVAVIKRVFENKWLWKQKLIIIAASSKEQSVHLKCLENRSVDTFDFDYKSGYKPLTPTATALNEFLFSSVHFAYIYFICALLDTHTLSHSEFPVISSVALFLPLSLSLCVCLSSSSTHMHIHTHIHSFTLFL